MNNKLSIVTVCYNSDKTIEQTFLSILSQTVLPYEYVIVDGASTDNTLLIIQEYEDKFKEKKILFKYISEKDNGLYDAMNKGLFMAEGEWIHFLNSDDQYASPDVLEKIAPFFNNKYDIIYGNIILFSEDGIIKVQKPKGLPRKYVMYFSCPIFQPATFSKTSVLKKFGFDIKYKNSADYKLWIQLISDNVVLKYVDINVTLFKTGGASTNLSKMNNENIHLFKELKIYFGAFIHQLYFHMYISDFLKKKLPGFHEKLKHYLTRNNL
jgi:glycosyltransferase involved in cell wall biosynthesis